MKKIDKNSEIFLQLRQFIMNSFFTNELQSQQESCIALEDYEAHEPGQLTVNKGQRLQVFLLFFCKLPR